MINLQVLIDAILADLDVDQKSALYVRNRLLQEGPNVVLKLLPAYSKHILLCLEKGQWEDFVFNGGSPFKKLRGLPIFLRGYLSQVFGYNPRAGLIQVRPNACPVALYAIRQTCEYLGKLALPYADQLRKEFTVQFEKCDDEVMTGEYDHRFVDAMRRNLETYYPSVARVTLDSISKSARPGPGTYVGSSPSSFWQRNFRRPTVRSRDIPLAHGLRVNRKSEKAAVYDGDPKFSEVLFVNKDYRGPRVIVREPYNDLIFQMGYNTELSRALERDSGYRINFQSQQINRDLAKTASIDKKWTTIDLKEASDRVSYTISAHLLRYLPIGRALARFRNPWCKLPDGSFRLLRKLAGMGSGFTFPTMAMIIHIAICTHISRRFGVRYRQAMKSVYVYGDDIIVPTTWYEEATKALNFVGLKVNINKCFTRSHFRESCGGDYYYGNDVAPIRLTLKNASPVLNGLDVIPGSRQGQYELFVLGVERHARELVKKQLHCAARYLYSILEEILGPLPLITGDTPVFGRYTENREEVLQGLSTTSNGAYRKRDYWVARPVRGVVSRASVYQYYRSAVRKVPQRQKWELDLFPAGAPRAAVGVTTIPRRVKLQKLRLSSLTTT